MKKLLATLLLALTGLTQAVAKENITIIYAFGVGDSVANYSRTLVEEANRLQDKYNFMFDVKPGGGQVVAFNYVKNTPDTILMGSGAYWLRPIFYPTQSYDVNEFRTILTQCNLPFAMASSKYTTWKDVPKDQPVTIATAGLGVGTHLMALEIIKKYPNATVIPYKSTVDGLMAALGGQVDFATGFVSDLEKFSNDPSKGKLNIFGVTGSKHIKNYPPLSSSGFSSRLDRMNSPINLMVPRSFSDAKAHEIREILLKAESKKSVRDSYAIDYCDAYQVPEKDLSTWWADQNHFWNELTTGLGKLDQ
jgi:tripartite-type tricarboxylate transporter receptor subunit TctC